MKRIFSGFLVGLTMVLSGATGAFAAGAAVESDTLKLTLPFVEYAGQRYHVVMDYAGTIDGGLYWRLASISPTRVAGQCGGAVDANLNVRDVCVLLSGHEYKISLNFDPVRSSWRLADAIQPQACTITDVRGGEEECYDMAWIIRVQQCSVQCGDNLDCQLGCMGDSMFKLAIEFSNTTSSAQSCVLPSGMVFRAEDVHIQDMLLIRGEAFQVPARSTKRVCVPTYCLNSNRSGPDATSLYSTSGGVASACMIEIVNSVYGKTISNGATLQEVVWECADTGAITEEQRTFLRNLPAAN